MTAITFNIAPRITTGASKLKCILAMIARALDAYAMHRMRHAVPEYELRRANRTIKRYGRLLHQEPAKPRARKTRPSRNRTEPAD